MKLVIKITLHSVILTAIALFKTCRVVYFACCSCMLLVVLMHAACKVCLSISYEILF